jgi:hypothetical protein
MQKLQFHADQQDIALQETHVTNAVRPGLPKDDQGRPFLLTDQKSGETLDLVERMVALFMQLEGRFPTIIKLSAFRYLTYGMLVKYYLKGAEHIRYTYEEGCTYEVMVKGEASDAR